jgi:hypothetical protein
VFWFGNLTEREHLEDQSLNERIILEWIFKKSFGAVLDSCYSAEGQVTNSDDGYTLLRNVSTYLPEYLAHTYFAILSCFLC